VVGVVLLAAALPRFRRYDGRDHAVAPASDRPDHAYSESTTGGWG